MKHLMNKSTAYLPLLLLTALVSLPARAEQPPIEPEARVVAGAVGGAAGCAIGVAYAKDTKANRSLLGSVGACTVGGALGVAAGASSLGIHPEEVAPWENTLNE